MINKIGMSPVGPSDEQKQIAKSNNLDWDRYVRKIEELKTNPPQMFEVTIPYFTWYHQTEFPAWYANELIATGVSKDNIPPTYDKKLIVTESYLDDLQKQVPGYLKYITAIDSPPQDPSTPQINVGNVTANDAKPQQTASAADTITTSSTTTTSPTSTTSSKTAATTAQTKQSTNLLSSEYCNYCGINTFIATKYDEFEHFLLVFYLNWLANSGSC